MFTNIILNFTFAADESPLLVMSANNISIIIKSGDRTLLDMHTQVEASNYSEVLESLQNVKKQCNNTLTALINKTSNGIYLLVRVTELK